MSEPATPTAAERAETRALAARIVESVRADAPFPHALTTMVPTRGNVNQEAAEETLFALAQEIEQLRAELADLRAKQAAFVEVSRG